MQGTPRGSLFGLSHAHKTSILLTWRCANDLKLIEFLNLDVKTNTTMDARRTILQDKIILRNINVIVVDRVM